MASAPERALCWMRCAPTRLFPTLKDTRVTETRLEDDQVYQDSSWSTSLPSLEATPCAYGVG